MRGNHIQTKETSACDVGRVRLTVPWVLPGFLLNYYSMKAFNLAYYWKHGRMERRIIDYDRFFYPLDSIGNWNRIYGRNGFFQYQLVVPFSKGHGAVREILAKVVASKSGTFLAVLKTFGGVVSPGMLSFPSPGVTVALDFPNRGGRTLRLFEELDELVMNAGGRVYPAKDARMPARVFQRGFPRWQEFTHYIDPQFSSSFWRRVTT